MRDLKLVADSSYDNKNAPINLLNTIKMPRDIKEINQRLPKKKMYNREFEESNLMQYDVNINRTPNNAEIDLNVKEKNNINVSESKELNSKIKEREREKEKEKERDIIINNLLRNKENASREAPKDNLIKIQKNVIIINPISNNNQRVINNNMNYNYNDPRNNQNKKDNYVLVKPSSVNSDNRSKTPIQQVNIARAIEIQRNPNNNINDNSNNKGNNNMNNNNNIMGNQLNRNKPVQIIAGIPQGNVYNNQNNYHPNVNRNNIMKLDGVNVIQAKIEHANNNKPKEVHSRPQSANNNLNNNNNKPSINYNYNNNYNKRPNNPIFPSDRSKSPNLVIRRNIPLSANSPRNKSPIKEKYNSNNANNANHHLNVNANPTPNKPKPVNPYLKSPDINVQNNNVKYINNNRVEIQKINYDYAKLNQNGDLRKVQNYHYIRNSNENVKGLKEKLMLNNKNVNRGNDNLQNYNYLINRQNSNNPSGPKIVVINQKK
jgi:hypothetical protein